MSYRTQSDFQALVYDRLEHLAQRVYQLHNQGEHELAFFLEKEGHELAEASDRGNLFWVGKIAD